jgi:hypothetical protein
MVPSTKLNIYCRVKISCAIFCVETRDNTHSKREVECGITHYTLEHNILKEESWLIYEECAMNKQISQ